VGLSFLADQIGIVGLGLTVMSPLRRFLRPASQTLSELSVLFPSLEEHRLIEASLYRPGGFSTFRVGAVLLEHGVGSFVVSRRTG
jgi:hypothetical protein